MSPKKILTRLEVGKLELSHRVVLAAEPRFGSGSYRRLATPGGLLITPPIAVTLSDGASAATQGGLLTPGGQKPWRAVIGAVHAVDGRLIARLQCPGDPSSPSPDRECGGRQHAAAWPPEVLATCEAMAVAARELGFDGIELCLAEVGAGLLAIPGVQAPSDGGCSDPWHSLPVEILQPVLDAWPSDRVGVRLSAAPALRSAGALGLFCGLLAMLNEMEIAFLHLVDAKPLEPGDGGPRIAAAAMQMRHAFRWPMMASGPFSTRDAARLVESRWADAVCFPDEADGPALLGRLAALRG